MPAVSVIIPNYNHAPYLTQRIESVLIQTFQDFELIILDDCSTDHSKEIIEAYKTHPKIVKIIYNEINSGSTFKQWYKGINEAAGEYIWIAESDDWAEPAFLEILIENIRLNNCDLAYVHSIPEVSGIVRNKYLEREGEIIAHNNISFIKENMFIGNILYNASMVLFKKEFSKQIDWERVFKYKYCGDWMFWIQFLLLTKKCVEIRLLLNHFRQHAQSVSLKSEKEGLHISEGISVILYLFERIKLDFKEELKVLNFWIFKLIYFNGGPEKNYLFEFMKINPFSFLLFLRHRLIQILKK